MPANFINESDQSLLVLMAGNNQDAFTALYRRHWEKMYISVVKVIKCKEDAADIVQEVFLSLWNRRNELSISGSLAAYLNTSVKYKAIHFIEKNYTRRNYIALIEKLSEISTSPSPEANLYTKQMEEVLQVVIKKMPYKMQEVYRLSRNEYLTHKEIATRLCISEETVKKHIQHALFRIKKAFTQPNISLNILLFTFIQ